MSQLTKQTTCSLMMMVVVYKMESDKIRDQEECLFVCLIFDEPIMWFSVSHARRYREDSISHLIDLILKGLHRRSCDGNLICIGSKLIYSRKVLQIVELLVNSIRNGRSSWNTATWIYGVRTFPHICPYESFRIPYGYYFIKKSE